jgi:hypothetical protein
MYKEWIIMKFSKKKMHSVLEGRRTVERLKRRWMDGWMDGVVEDMRKMGIQRWWMGARDLRVVAERSTGSQGLVGCSAAADEGFVIVSSLKNC